MSTRQDIAAALTATGLVRVTARHQSRIKPNEGVVRWVGRVRDDSTLGYLDTWQAWIGLPGAIAAAEDWLTDHLDTLMAAMDSVVVIESADPAELVLGANVVPGLILQGVAPADPPPPPADPVPQYMTEEV